MRICKHINFQGTRVEKNADVKRSAKEFVLTNEARW